MASKIGEQSSRTPAGENKREPHRGSTPASPLERLRSAPPFLADDDRLPGPSGITPPTEPDVPVGLEPPVGPEPPTDLEPPVSPEPRVSPEPPVSPEPIVRLPSPPRHHDTDGPVPADDQTDPEPITTAAGTWGRRDDGSGGSGARGMGSEWAAGSMPAWLSGVPPAIPRVEPADARGHLDGVPDPDQRGTDYRDTDNRDTRHRDTDDRRRDTDDRRRDRWDEPDEDWEWDDDEPPGGRSRSRFAVAPPAAIALILVGVIACAVAGFAIWGSDDPVPGVDFPAAAAHTSTAPSTVQPAPDESAPAPAAAEPSRSAPQPDAMVVSVVGLVGRPGLVRLPPGARVADAIERAGGARKNADLLSLNLAQLLRDGDQVLVGYAGRDGEMSMRSAVVGAGPTSAPASDESSVPDPAGGTAPTGGSGTVNLNTASQTELESLPGVGPVTAKSILDWRQRNGRFTSVDQLTEVDGIGPARLEKLRDKVIV
ncbi:helix-hairpin-helix domain-containing protein [Gordonia pseudamarae]|uniref:helix-hairpin-helix domain-containing protein n=1 Tax=Gordonia pseudamarae TaxID=2831662 RepID=UPI003969F0B1